MSQSPRRCDWCLNSDLNRVYHDCEWGLPLYEDRALFETLSLESAQAGLSWLTILQKRPGYRRLFAGFDPWQVAAFGEAEVARLLADKAIVRHRGKIEATVTNARAVLELAAEYGSFAAFVWHFVDGRPLQNRWQHLSQVPASTPLSSQLSRELRRRGFAFVGPTTCYAFMQAAGLVNDHLVSCFRHAEVARLSGTS